MLSRSAVRGPKGCAKRAASSSLPLGWCLWFGTGPGFSPHSGLPALIFEVTYLLGRGNGKIPEPRVPRGLSRPLFARGLMTYEASDCSVQSHGWGGGFQIESSGCRARSAGGPVKGFRAVQRPSGRLSGRFLPALHRVSDGRERKRSSLPSKRRPVGNRSGCARPHVVCVSFACFARRRCVSVGVPAC